MEIDDNLKRLMKELGAAINDSLAESEPISHAIENIKEAGYDIFLVLEATIGFNKRSGDVIDDSSTESSGTPRSHLVHSENLELTNQDTKFLKSLRISIDEDRRSES